MAQFAECIWDTMPQICGAVMLLGEMPLDDAVDGLMEVEKIIGEVIRTGRERIAAEKAKSAKEGAQDA
jgi:hypothetical protein